MPPFRQMDGHSTSEVLRFRKHTLWCRRSEGVEHRVFRHLKEMESRRAWLLATACLCASSAAPAAGQPVPNPGSPLPGVLRPAEPPVSPSLPHAPQAAPGAVAANQTVSVSTATVEDATAYPPSALSPIIAGLTGPSVAVARIEDARTAILNRYRADGYVYTSVNARIRDGHLRFVVTEGRIVDVKLDGNIGPAGTQVLRFLRHLTDIRPIDTKSLERWLLLAGDVPGVTLTSVLNPSTEDPGALTLVAKVTRQSVTGQISADNRAFRQTGPEEFLALVDFNSFTSFGERTEASIYHTFNNTETFGQASEEFFIGGSGLKFRIYGGAGETTPSGSLRALGYDGVTRVFGADFAYPVIRSRQQTLNVNFAFDGIESEITTDTGSAKRQIRSSFDSLRVLTLGGDYTRLDLLAGQNFPANDLAILHVSRGLTALGASRDGDKQASQLGERIDFTKLDGELDRTQSLFTPFAGGAVSLKAAITGQYSGDILPAAEKFYLGGPHFGRGFYYGQVTGDSGAEATLEPLLDTKLGQTPYLKLPMSAQFYAFYDWGETYENLKQNQEHVIRSVGGGVRYYLGERAEIDLEGVSRLTRTPNGAPPVVSRLKSSAVYWQVLARF